MIKDKREVLARGFLGFILAVYLICCFLFQKDYYTDYRKVTEIWYAAGVEQCIEHALEACETEGLNTIVAAEATQWTRVLYYLQILPTEYLEPVVYKPNKPRHPSYFKYGDIHFYTTIDYENINQNSVYIIYFTDAPLFEEAYDLTRYYDFYVAVPKVN